MRVETIALKIMLIGLLTAALNITSRGMASAGISKTGSDDCCNLCHVGGNSTDGTTSQTCLECHSSSDSSTTYDMTGGGQTVTVPVVFNTNVYPAEPLAGGSSYYTSLGGSENDKYGHNVEGISNADSNLMYVPGKHFVSYYQLSITDCYNCHELMAGWPGIPFTKSRNGDVLICEDCHTPKHHADDSATVVDGRGGWYRFIYGVKGIEDSDWEKTVSPTDHNEYQGEIAAFGGSISDFGCGCHGDFHALRNPSDVGSGSPWLRHPVDIALPITGEYLPYTTYNPEAPVARPDLLSYSDPSEIVTPGIDQVMCLSCHRAHGSPYPKMLRWDPNSVGASCATCHTEKPPNGTDYHHVKDCNVCHSHHGGGFNLYLIKEVIPTPNSGDRSVIFTYTSGPNSYADGDGTYNGICEVCHTSTSHHRNDGSDNTEHFDGQNCISCHPHSNQFSYVLPYEQSHDTHLTSDNGPKIACTDCHSDPLQFNPTIFADGRDFGDTAVCDTCHSPDGAYDGVNDLTIGARPNWPEGVYEKTGDILKEGKRNWCAGCHDNGVSIIDNVAAPNIMGDNITYGYNISGHGRNPQNYIDCSDCHKPTATHTDGVARTYSSSINNYKDGYRLKYSMDIPRKTTDYRPEVFELCFKCHTYGDIFDQVPPFKTNFRDDKISQNYHYLHLFQYGFDYWDSDWDSVLDSGGSCTACHNIHGSPTSAMTRHGELISTLGTLDKVPALDFRWYKSDGKTPTTKLKESRYGSLICGGPGYLSTNNVCVGCHATGRLTYYRPPVVEEEGVVVVERVWTTDLSNNAKTDFAPGENIRYHVKFTITGTGSYFVKAIGKAFNMSGEDWVTKFRRRETLSEGTYHRKWNKTIPLNATPSSGAKVRITVKMFDAPGGNLLDSDVKGKQFHIVAP